MDNGILEDFPANEAEFDERFSTEEACYKYLFDLRWPDGFRCPKCGNKQYWLSHPGFMHLLRVRVQPVGHGWDDPAQHQKTPQAVVQGQVA
jgi:hypothetical protein